MVKRDGDHLEARDLQAMLVLRYMMSCCDVNLVDGSSIRPGLAYLYFASSYYSRRQRGCGTSVLGERISRCLERVIAFSR